MWEDPIVAEVHRTREKLAAQYNFDVGAFFADIRKRQAALAGRLVAEKKQAEPTAEGHRALPSRFPEPTPSEAARAGAATQAAAKPAQSTRNG